MLKELLISAAVIAGFASAASAQTCATPPSCASLGYTLTAPKGPGWVCTGCPFDPTKFACTAKPCPKGSSTTKPSSCANYRLEFIQGSANTITQKTYSESYLLNLNTSTLCIDGYSGDSACLRCPAWIVKDTNDLIPYCG